MCACLCDSQQAYFGAAPISAPFGDTYGTTGVFPPCRLI